MTEVALIVGGLVALFLGGEGLVRGAVALTQRLGVSPLLAGLTVVAAGTSAPELVVSVQASFRGEPDIVLGNVIGSNIANILLILGASALIRPIASSRAAVFRDGGVVLGATLIVLAISISGTVERWQGISMLAMLVSYLVFTYFREREQPLEASIYAEEVAEYADRAMPLWTAILLVVAGAGALVAGADWLVEGAVALAVAAGVPRAVVGLTLVAVGTSLPELATSLVAAMRKHADVAVGNAIGSCIFNFLGILAITATLTPLTVAPRFAQLDLPVLLLVLAVSLPILVSGWRISRSEGALFLAAYGGYTGWLYTGAA